MSGLAQVTTLRTPRATRPVQHGDVVAWRVENEDHPVTITGADGQTYTTYRRRSQPVSWRFCGGCRRAIRIAGLDGALEWMANHGEAHRPAEQAEPARV